MFSDDLLLPSSSCPEEFVLSFVELKALEQPLNKLCPINESPSPLVPLLTRSDELIEGCKPEDGGVLPLLLLFGGDPEEFVGDARVLAFLVNKAGIPGDEA